MQKCAYRRCPIINYFDCLISSMFSIINYVKEILFWLFHIFTGCMNTGLSNLLIDCSYDALKINLSFEGLLSVRGMKNKDAL